MEYSSQWGNMADDFKWLDDTEKFKMNGLGEETRQFESENKEHYLLEIIYIYLPAVFAQTKSLFAVICNTFVTLYKILKQSWPWANTKYP